MIIRHWLMFVLPALVGCGASTQSLDAPASGRIVCFVAGVAGDKGAFAGLKDALVEKGVTDLRNFGWGVPGPLFIANFQDETVHNNAESDLARRIDRWLKERPDCKVDLVGHSAGCGVVLGAVRRVRGGEVHRVMLLSPSVSPGYDLAPVLIRVSGRMDVFHSDRDTFFLKWRTGTFGTYDNVKTAAAGHLGFKPPTPLHADLAKKLVQHPYDPSWEELGNGGGHTGTTARGFQEKVLAPLLAGN